MTIRMKTGSRGQAAGRLGQWISSLALALGFVSGEALARMQVIMTPGVTPISENIYFLHMTIFWICVIIGVLVFGIMLYSLIRHRRSLGVKPATFHENTKLEIFWAIIPLLILVVMAFPATKVLMQMD